VQSPRAVAFSPDGRYLAAGRGWPSGHLWLLNAATGHLIAETPAHEKQLFGVTFSPDGQSIATCSEDGTAKFWMLTDGTGAN
jgi:WD40 repeat protein